jgi:hypothetical protein
VIRRERRRLPRHHRPYFGKGESTMNALAILPSPVACQLAWQSR